MKIIMRFLSSKNAWKIVLNIKCCFYTRLILIIYFFLQNNTKIFSLLYCKVSALCWLRWLCANWIMISCRKIIAWMSSLFNNSIQGKAEAATVGRQKWSRNIDVWSWFEVNNSAHSSSQSRISLQNTEGALSHVKKNITGLWKLWSEVKLLNVVTSIYFYIFFLSNPLTTCCFNDLFVILTKLNNDGNLFLLQQHFRNFS